MSTKQLTPFEAAGYTKDTKFRMLIRHGQFRKGDIVVLDFDDGSVCPWFRLANAENLQYKTEYALLLPGEVVCGPDRIEVYKGEEDNITYPIVEKKLPYTSEEEYYRIHYNELAHRDITKQEAMIIYKQLKTLLGE